MLQRHRNDRKLRSRRVSNEQQQCNDQKLRSRRVSNEQQQWRQIALFLTVVYPMFGECSEHDVE